MDAVVIVIAVTAVVILLTGVAVLAWWLRRDTHRGVPAHGPPFVIFPAHVEHSEIHPPGLGASTYTGAVDRPAAMEPDGGETMALEAVPIGATGARTSGGVTRVARRPRRTPRPALATEVESTPLPAPAPEAMNGTLRMLPGRLEVLGGLPTRAEIRFVRLGTGDQTVTLGRQPGPPYEHVQLPSQTVSRQHAVMRYSRGGWSIANLSETNPLRVNGDEAAAGEEPIALRDGDLIEMGEVQLRFRT